jgi:hypothetical protein
MKTWEAKTKGRILFVLMYLFGLVVVYFEIIIGVLLENYHMVDKKELPLEYIELISPLIVFFPALIVITIVPIYWILKKKTPKRITVDNNDITFWYTKKKFTTKSLDKIGFSIHDYSYYSALTIFEKIQPDNSQYWYYKQMFGIVGLIITISWNQKTIQEMSDEFEKTGIKKFNLKDKKPFLLRLIE